MKSSASLSRKALVLGSGQLFTTLITLAVGALLARGMQVSEYAAYRQFLLLFALFAPTLTLGLPRALYFFLPTETRRPRGVVMDNVILLLVSALILGVFVLSGGTKFLIDSLDNSSLAPLIALLVPYAIFMFPLDTLNACLMALGRVSLLVYFNLASRLALGGVLLFALWYRPTALSVVSATVAWSSVAGVSAMVLMFCSTSGSLRISLRGMKKQLAFAIPLGLASMSGAITLQIDKLIVSSMCSTREFAIYVTGAMEVPIIAIVTGSISSVLLPEMAVLYQSNRLNEVARIWKEGINKALLVLMPIAAAILLLSNEFMTIVFSERYEASSTPFRIYALMLPMRAAVFGSVLTATNRTKFVTLAAIIGLVLNAGLSLLLVALIGMNGAAWATIVSVVAVNTTMLFAIGKTLKCSVRSLIDWAHLRNTFLAAALPACVLAPFVFSSDLKAVTSFLCFGTLYTAMLLAIYFFTRMLTLKSLVQLVRRSP